MQHKKGFKIALMIGVGCIAVAGYGIYLNQPTTYYAAVPVKGNIAETIEVDGSIEGEEEQEFYANVTAPIRMLNIKVGGTVSKGNIVLEYDTKDIEKAYQEAELSAAAMDSQYASQVKQSEKQEQKYKKASADEQAYKEAYQLARSWQSQLVQGQYSQSFELGAKSQEIEKQIAEESAKISEKESEITTLTNDLTEVELDIAENKGQIASLQIDLSRLTPGSDEYNSAAEDLEDKEDDLDDLEDKRKEKKKKLDSKSESVSDLYSNIANLKADVPNMADTQMSPEENLAAVNYNQYLEDVLRNLSETQTDIGTSENLILNEDAKKNLFTNAQMMALKAGFIKEDLEIGKEGITSQFDGIVTKLYVKENAYVSTGTPLFAIQSSDDLKVVVKISKYDIGKIAVGQKAKIQVGSLEYEGTVSNINRLAETDNTDKAKVKVDIHVDDSDEGVILGIEADATIYTKQKENVLLIPREALYTDDQGDYCYCIEANTVVKNHITTGIKTKEQVEVVDGITDSSVVVIDAITDDKIGEKANADLN